MTSTPAEATTGRQSALYTPEAVRIDLPLADVGSRTLAILLDLLIMFTILYAVLLAAIAAVGGFAAAGLESGPGWVVVVMVLLLNFLVLWGYPTGAETLMKGRTPGKAALGLRVVTADGAPIRFRHAAIRGLFAFVDFYILLGIPALITALVTRKGQRLGDLAAGTVTIRDRKSAGAADEAIFWQVPPQLHAYAATLDVRGLSAQDYALIRRFLLRAATLAPEHRERVATDLANVLARRMHHTPPPGTHPESLLLCTAALLQQAPGLQAPPQVQPLQGPPHFGQAPPQVGGWQPQVGGRQSQVGGRKPQPATPHQEGWQPPPQDPTPPPSGPFAAPQ
ncbi:hypothetical protein BH23ACT9_BH23ACT9_00310 [soil metagenome]